MVTYTPPHHALYEAFLEKTRLNNFAIDMLFLYKYQNRFKQADDVSKLFILLAAVLTMNSTLLFAEKCQSLQAMNWLLGDWKSAAGKSFILESWQQVSPKTYQGMAESRNNKSHDLLSSETMQLVEMSGGIFYFAKVKQNDLPVAFKLTECTNTMVVFENSQHDFPKKLQYQLANDSVMNVLVSDGKNKGFNLVYNKVVPTQ